MSSHASQYPIWLPVGDQGLMLDFTGFTPVTSHDKNAQDAAHITQALAAKIAAMAEALRALPASGMIEIVPSLTRLFIHFDNQLTTAEHIKAACYPLLTIDSRQTEGKTRIWHMPICYEGACAPDLGAVAKATNMSETEVIERHLAQMVTVAVMGFLPGLGYMTGVDARLTLPRRSNPRTHVPARSVGIAMGQCVIYPLESPGGWHLIGRTSFPIFDKDRADPILFRAADKVQFQRISEAEFVRQEAAYNAGELKAEQLLKGSLS